MRDCQVNHLHFKTSEPDATRHAALLVEDGLRTASFPDEGGRLVIVRSLALGRIGHNASALTVSMQIEQALQRLPMQLVHATSATAAKAPAIYFRDEVEAFILFARQLAQGISPSAWFWQRLIPGYRPEQSCAEGYRLLLQTLLAKDAGNLLLLRLVEQLVEAGIVDPLLALLQPQDGELLLQRYGWQPRPTPLKASIPQPMRHKPAFTALLRTWGQRWKADEPRTLWLANLLSAIEQPLRLADPHLSTQSQQWIDYELSLRHTELEALSTVLHAVADADSDQGLHTDVINRTVQTAKQPNVSTRPLDEPVVVPSKAIPATGQDGAVTDDEASQVPLWESELQPTAAGGILFLLNGLTRLHFGDWLVEHPQWLEADLPLRLLATLCQQLAVAEDDPVWQMISVAGAEGDGIEQVIAQWLAQLNAWCSEIAELDLAMIVLRPARLHATPTHIELYFSLDQVNLRIRRVGLDFDPGWVAWLGRVVMFHYG